MPRKLCDTLAALLDYPEPGYPLDAVGERQSSAGRALSRFVDEVRHLRLHDLQELFIQTFDLSPLCSLEMGWHLFGENYDRGLLLVKMRQQLRAHGLVESAELPDHLSNGLRLLPRMEHGEAEYFAEAVVLPALAKMLESLRGKNNPYEHLLEAARLAVRADFPAIPEELAVRGADTGLRVLTS